jgi:hypothetical protein
MSCSVCYERGYYLITLGDEHEIVRCDCQISSDLSSQVGSNVGRVPDQE